MGLLLVNADDYGISQNVNEAIKLGILDGVIDRATVMVNMPYAEEAYNLAKENKYLMKIGLHINLVEGVPLTENIKKTSLCDNGLFNGSISNAEYKTGFIKDENILKCIEEEIDAQMKKFISMGFMLRHLDSHQHSHIKPSVFPIVHKLAYENDFNSMRLASVIPSDHPKLTTRIYKKIINMRIKKFNKSRKLKDTMPLIDAGCAFLSLKKQKDYDDGQFIKNNNVEMWFHPAIVDNKIVNLFCKEPFDVQDIVTMKKISMRKLL